MACCGRSNPRQVRAQQLRSGVKSGKNKCPLCGAVLRRVYSFDYATKKNRIMLKCSACQYRAKTL